jgi:hypothetical protein
MKLILENCLRLLDALLNWFNELSTTSKILLQDVSNCLKIFMGT